MKVHVDQEKCQGHGRCYSLAPQVFEPDDLGNGVEIGVGVVPDDFVEIALKAARNCPELAIEVEDAPEGVSV